MAAENWCRDRGVVITGGLGDIGLATARAFLALGARVTLMDRRPAEEAAARIAELDGGERAAYLQVDVRDGDAVSAALEPVEPLDFMIGNAGIVDAAPFLDITHQQWRDHLEVNLTGCFNVGQAAARLMVRRGRPGRIVFTGSWVQEVPWPEIAAYSASKAGIRMLARSMARELADHGIRVNVIAPGIVNAGLAGEQLRTDPGYAARVQKVIALEGLQSPDDVAGGMVFLCSPAADQMTGSVLLIDGGCSLYRFD